jgi:hypothetical protein
MKSETDTLEQLAKLLKMEMPENKRYEIWNSVEQAMKAGRPMKKANRRRSTALVSSTVAIATVAIVVGGVYAISNRGPALHGISGSHEAPIVTPSEPYQAPTSVQGIALAGDGPSASWYFPTDPAVVTKQVYTWLQAATPTKVEMPKENGRLITVGNIGPARLSFTNQAGHRITVFPAFYIVQGDAKGNPSMTQFSPSYFPNVLAYQEGGQTIYLQSPGLYAWLKNNQWASEFQPESYTDIDKKAIQAALASPWGSVLQGLAPTVPDVNVSQIPHGGPAPLDGKSSLLPGTCTTQAQPQGINVRVKFSETWNNGNNEHTWTFIVAPDGRILSHSEAGDIAPQNWK